MVQNRYLIVRCLRRCDRPRQMVRGCDETVGGPPRFHIGRRGEMNIPAELGVISRHVCYIFRFQVDDRWVPALLIPDDAVGSQLGIAISDPMRVATRVGAGGLSPKRFGARVPHYGGQDDQ